MKKNLLSLRRGSFKNPIRTRIQRRLAAFAGSSNRLSLPFLLATGLVFASDSARADDEPPMTFAAAGPGEVVVLNIPAGTVNPFFPIVGAVGAGGRAEVHLFPGGHQFDAAQSGAMSGSSSLVQLRPGTFLTTGPAAQQLDHVGGLYGVGGDIQCVIEGGAQWTSLNEAVVIDDGSVSVSGGGIFRAKSIQMAQNYSMLMPGLVSTLEIAGVGSRLETDELDIGKWGRLAFAEVTGGATVSATELSIGKLGHLGSGIRAEGTLNVSGANSLMESEVISVGFYGRGFMEIKSAGRIQTGTLVLGGRLADNFLYSSENGEGEVTVEGESSSLAVASDALIGHEGSGVFRVRDTAQADVGDFIVGDRPSGEGLVEIESGSSLNVTGIVSVGNEGQGTFRLLSEAEAQVDGIFAIGALPGSTGFAEIGNADLTLNEDLYVGYEGEGLLHINHDANVASTRVAIGALEGSLGEVRVRGATWVNDGFFAVGLEDKGGLTIEEGAWVATDSLRIALQTPGGQEGQNDSRVTVQGAGSSFSVVGELEVAREGVGQLYVLDGAETDAGDVIVGTDAGSFGHVELSGAETRMTALTAQFGQSGQGQMQIKSGAGFVAGGLWLGTEEDAVGIIEVEHSTLEVTGTLHVGGAGGGRVSLQAGGTLLTSDAHVPSGPGLGRLFIDGDQSVWFSNGKLYLGHGGTGELRVSEGAGAVVHWMSVGPNGTVTAPALNVGSAAAAVAQAADALQLAGLQDSPESALQVERLELHPGATLDVDQIETTSGGEISGGGAIPGNLTNRGLLQPGSENAGGILAVAGSYTQETGAVLEIVLGHDADYSHLTVGGTATLGGTLRILIADGFVPAEESRFEILRAAQISGAFDQLELPEGMAFTVEGGNLVLTAGEPPTALSLIARRAGNGSVELLTGMPAGMTYRVQRSEDLAEWTDWSEPIVSDGDEHSITLPPETPHSFFRLRIIE